LGHLRTRRAGVRKAGSALNGSNFQDFRTQFPHFRQYTPTFIETFRFAGIPLQKPLLKALDTLRQMNREERTIVPSEAPRSFVRANWAPFVFVEGGIDRCFYELCALSELCLGLKSGDIWVEGSRRYRKFDAYLIEASVWAERKESMQSCGVIMLDLRFSTHGADRASSPHRAATPQLCMLSDGTLVGEQRGIRAPL
jgi:hypothetical protein